MTVTINGFPAYEDEELGKDLDGPPVAFGPCGGIWTPATGFVTIEEYARLRKLSAVDGVAEARLTTDPE